MSLNRKEGTAQAQQACVGGGLGTLRQRWGGGNSQNLTFKSNSSLQLIGGQTNSEEGTVEKCLHPACF